MSFVNKVELGERRLDPVDLWYLAAAYGRPITEFLPDYPPALRRPVARRSK